jgi:hypothetical protein
VNFEDGTGLSFLGGFRIEGVIIWAVGIAVYFVTQKLKFVLGASFTAFVATAVLHLVVERMVRPTQKA